MATNYQFRVTLRPSPIGLAIMSRLEAPGADRTSEARRWLELGFAAEQAGFRMDGCQLRHADKAWAVQPSILPVAGVPVAVDQTDPRVPAGASDAVGQGSVSEPVPPVPAPAPSIPPGTPLANPEVASSPLLGPLRGLSAI